MECHSAIRSNDIGSFVGKWMDTEIVIQSEVSQKEKNGCCKSVHKYMGNLKKWYR